MNLQLLQEQIQALQSNPSLFQAEIHVPTGSGPCRFGSVMADFQRERFGIVNPSLLALAQYEPPPVPRIWDERTKGGSKDTDWSVNLLWLLTFCRRPIRIQVGAYDRDQADEIRLIIKSILRIHAPLNRFINQVIDVQTNRVINRRTESQCEILTSDRLGSHGARPDLVLINELTHQQDSGFAETLLDNLDKMPNGFGVIATNSGFTPSWQLEWKQTFAESDRWKVLQFNEPSPWVTEAALEESRRRNSSARFARLWQGQWVSDTGDALHAGDIQACITETKPMTGIEKGYVFVAGLDIGIQKHATGLVIVGKHLGYHEEKEVPRKLTDRQRMLIDAGLMEEPSPEYETSSEEATHRFRLAQTQVWKPAPGKRVSLEAVKAAILQAHERFNLAGIVVDPHQAEHLIELLERENVPVMRTPQTVSSLQDQATALIEAVQERTIDLYHDDDLLADLRSLRIKDTGLRIRLISPDKTTDDGEGTAHGDLASALSFALSLAREKSHLTYANVCRTLIAWP